MMKKALYSIFCLVSLLAHAQNDEIDAIAHLIEATGKQLEAQKIVREEMVRFAELKKQFLATDNQKVIGAQLVASAKKIVHLLVEEHLTTLVSKEYLDELQFFATVRKGQ